MKKNLTENSPLEFLLFSGHIILFPEFMWQGIFLSSAGKN